jgi:AhpD family alkylhydroperoxidase
LKEAVSAAVSKINECPFCVEAHTTMLHAVSEHEAVEAILQGRSDQIKNPEMRAIVEWASATRTPGSPILLLPPFAPENAPEIIGVAVGFHYLNRMANIFLDEALLPIPPRLTGLKGVVRQLTGSMMKDLMVPTTSPGESLHFLPAAALPADLAWAAPNPHVAGAYARLAAAVEEAGQQSLPAEVRTLVQQQVQTWQGEAPGLSRRWVEEAIARLDEVHQAAARLALLTALASYQVDEGVITAFRSQHPGDDQLIGAAAWASFTAARRVGSWLHMAEAQGVA